MGSRQGTEGMALTHVWVDMDLHLHTPFQAVVESAYSLDSHSAMTCASGCPFGDPGEKVAGRCLYPLIVPMSS